MKIGKILRVYMYLYKKKPDWNDKIYNWKFVEIETLRLKGGIILKKKPLKTIMILVSVVLYITEGFLFYKRGQWTAS